MKDEGQESEGRENNEEGKYDKGRVKGRMERKMREKEKGKSYECAGVSEG